MHCFFGHNVSGVLAWRVLHDRGVLWTKRFVVVDTPLFRPRRALSVFDRHGLQHRDGTNECSLS